MGRWVSPLIPARSLVEELQEGGYYREAVALWGSVAFGRILGFASLHAGTPLTIGELLWRSRVSLDSVQRAVQRLVGASILIQGLRQGRASTFVLPASHPGLHFFRALALRTVALGPRFHLARDELGSESIRQAFVFGSTARLDDREESDLDVGVVGTVPQRSLVRHQDWLSEEVGRMVNIHIFDPMIWAQADDERGFPQRVKSGPRIPILP